MISRIGVPFPQTIAMYIKRYNRLRIGELVSRRSSALSTSSSKTLARSCDRGPHCGVTVRTPMTTPFTIVPAAVSPNQTQGRIIADSSPRSVTLTSCTSLLAVVSSQEDFHLKRAHAGRTHSLRHKCRDSSVPTISKIKETLTARLA